MSIHRPRLVAGLILLAMSVTIGVLVTHGGTPRADLEVVRAARVWRDGAVGDLMTFLSRVGYAVWLVPISLAIAVALAMLTPDRRAATGVALATAFASILTRVLKETFVRTRPEGAHELVAGFSMPSGHAAASSAFAISLVLTAWRTRVRWPVTVLAVAFALLVGVSRVVLGVHYPTDVLAGFCSGSGTACIVAAVVHLLPRRGVPASATR